MKLMGENPFSRNLFETNMILRIWLSFKKKNLKIKAKKICISVFKQTSFILVLDKKLYAYTLNGI